MNEESNVQLPVPSLKERKERYLELIAQGYAENKALELTNIPRATYSRMIMDDGEFVKSIEEARKGRAEHWIAMIAEDVRNTRAIDKDAIPAERLYFDKLMFLAKADNPDRYGSNKKSAEININLGQFKMLAPEEALKSLKNDPFAIPDAEFVEVEDDKDNQQDQAENPRE